METIGKIIIGLALAVGLIAITWLQIKLTMAFFPIIAIVIIIGVFQEIFSKRR